MPDEGHVARVRTGDLAEKILDRFFFLPRRRISHQNSPARRRWVIKNLPCNAITSGERTAKNTHIVRIEKKFNIACPRIEVDFLIQQFKCLAAEPMRLVEQHDAAERLNPLDVRDYFLDRLAFRHSEDTGDPDTRERHPFRQPLGSAIFFFSLLTRRTCSLGGFTIESSLCFSLHFSEPCLHLSGNAGRDVRQTALDLARNECRRHSDLPMSEYHD